MSTFDDFDAWGDAVRGANLRLVCDRVETPRWQLDTANLGSVVVQTAFEGGGNLCYGANTHRGSILFVPLTLADHHVVNGERLDDRSLLCIPPGADFRIQVRRRAHAWCSIALPEDEAPACGGQASGSRVVRADKDAVAMLRKLVIAIVTHPTLHSAVGDAHAAAAHALIDACRSCLGPAPKEPPVAGRPRIDRAEIIRRAIGWIERRPHRDRSVAALTRAVEVHDRTLTRAFHESFGLSPRAYLSLCLLHEVRRSLREADESRGDTVTDVLVRHGVWEFGRFAARYRRHFGESPSATLQQHDKRPRR